MGRKGTQSIIFISKVGIFPAVINLINCFCFSVHVHILYESTYDDGWMSTAMASLWTEGPLTVLPSLASFLIPETKTCLSSPQWESLPVFMTSSAHNSHSGNLSILLLPTGTPQFRNLLYIQANSDFNECLQSHVKTFKWKKE